MTQASVKFLERDEQIIRLRANGYSNKAIAEAIGLSMRHVSKRTSRLIKEGRTKPRRARVSTWQDVNNERVQTIIAMKKQRATLEEIGNALGLTRERARQLINRIVAVHGPAVFETDSPLWTAKEVALKLGVSTKTITRLCTRGEVSSRRRGYARKSTYLLGRAELEKLERHPTITRERVCSECGQHFVITPSERIRTVCSDECHKEKKQHIWAGYAHKTPTLDSLTGWHKDLWRKLQNYTLPNNEEWIAIGEAVRRTGLNRIQLFWLRHRKLVTTRPDPTRIAWRTGKPIMLFAVSEMEIARQAFETFSQKKGAKVA